MIEESVLVDSSYFIRALRTSKDPFQELSAASERYTYATCGVVMTEVCRGIRSPRMLQEAIDAFRSLSWVPTADHIWEQVLELAWNLARKGVTMQVTDMIIAASAKSVDASVLTLDSDFENVPGLRVIHVLD